MWIRSIIFVTIALISHTCSSRSESCSKHFQKDEVSISCLSENLNGTALPRLQIQHKENGHFLAKDVSCKPYSPNKVLCKQVIPLRHLGIGDNEIIAVITYSVKHDVSKKQIIKIPVHLEIPAIELENCSYSITTGINAFCTCKRVDHSEVDTLIFTYLNNWLHSKTNGTFLEINIHVLDDTEIQCVAQNAAGWRSSISSVKYNVREKEYWKTFTTQWISKEYVTSIVLIIATYLTVTCLFKANETCLEKSDLTKQLNIRAEKDVIKDKIKISNKGISSAMHDGTTKGRGQSADIFSVLWKMCKESHNHKQLIPISKFNIDCLPDNFKDNDIIQLISCLSFLIVKIHVVGASDSRPDTHDGRPYPKYSTLLPDTLRTGTGRIHSVSIYPYDGDENCKCQKCTTDQTVTNNWGKICILTGRNVVFDKTEAKNTTCIWGFNKEDSTVKEFEGIDVKKTNTEEDMCLFECVTHDVHLLKRLRFTLESYASLCSQVYERFKYQSDKNLVIIISHPHGCTKHVSIGKVLEDNKLNKPCRYSYDAPTCRGCAGAPVYVLEKETGYWNPLHHSGKRKNMNISGLSWL